jgi:uncharacterized SAM-binding protein YcdF (DUF218 family)
MLYLHKLLPSVFLPIGITLVLVGAGLILRKRILCWTGIGILYLLSTGVVSGKIMRWAEEIGGPASLQTRSGGGAMQVSRREVDGVEPAEAVVVLSGMLQDRKDAPLGEWSDAVDRFEGGVELFKSGKAPILIFTGGHVPWRLEDQPEGEILKERAVKLGVPREKIQVTGKVGNTEDEASAVNEMFKNSKSGPPSLQTSLGSGGTSEGGRGAAEGGKRESRQLTANGQQHDALVGRRPWAEGGKHKIILVTSAYHMRRARMLFQRQGLEVEPFPVDFQLPYQERMTIISFLPNAECLKNSETAMREAMGIFYYTFIKR